MSRWTPCKRGDFIRKLGRLGFDGPLSGTRHQFIVIAQRRLVIPSNLEYSIPQLGMLVREVESLLGREVPLQDWASR